MTHPRMIGLIPLIRSSIDIGTILLEPFCDADGAPAFQILAIYSLHYFRFFRYDLQLSILALCITKETIVVHIYFALLKLILLRMKVPICRRLK